VWGVQFDLVGRQQVIIIKCAQYYFISCCLFNDSVSISDVRQIYSHLKDLPIFRMGPVKSNSTDTVLKGGQGLKG